MRLLTSDYDFAVEHQIHRKSDILFLNRGVHHYFRIGRNVIRMREQVSNDLFSKAVSTVLQPIESLFNWINEKTKIQNEQKVRSTKGLLLHIFGRIAAAFIYLIS